MENCSNWIPSSSSTQESVILDVKPLKSLAPMRPSSLGPNSAAAPTSSPQFVCFTPFGSFSASSSSGLSTNFKSFFPTAASPQPSNQTPVYATPLNARNGVIDFTANGPTSALGKKMKKPIGSSEPKKRLTPKKPRKVYDHDTLLLPSSSSQDIRESVEVILMTFDALRRRVEQVDELQGAGKKMGYLKVGPIMTNNDLRVNADKRIGVVPGVEIGDIFYFRFELCLIGLHAQTMAGIDTLTARFDNEEDTVAVCIVSAGGYGYDNEDGDVDTMIYSGHGGANKNDKSFSDDQKLVRGNLALERSLHRGNVIRVVRSAKDFACQTGKIYIYDGIYKVHESWVEKGKSGFNVFKFKLLREPGQPDGVAVWKNTQKWIENPSSRGCVIMPDISSGTENIPVCLVNDVDDEKGPHPFTYATNIKYLSPISSTNPLHRCMCPSVCLPGDANCSCAQHNGGALPYTSNGLLVSRKPLIYECNSSCACSSNCRNRVAQKGVRLNFEVFKTRDRGWGLRCWHPIRAGSFICECTGEVINKSNAKEDGDNNEYIFQGFTDDKSLKWNYIPELLSETSAVALTETPKPLSFVISAKNFGNIARFMNHSCSPNVFWQPVQHDHSDEGYPHIMFFAIKHIPPMTELTFDYGLSEDKGERTKQCLCGSSKCRGFFS